MFGNYGKLVDVGQESVNPRGCAELTLLYLLNSVSNCLGVSKNENWVLGLSERLYSTLIAVATLSPSISHGCHLAH